MDPVDPHEIMKAIVQTVAVALLVCGSLAWSQDDGPTQVQGDADARVTALEAELGLVKQKNDALAADLAETKTLLEKTVAYVDAQAKSAATLASNLDEVERLGFTYGINPDSRTTLLRGWREQLAIAQAAVPSLPAQKPTAGRSDAKKKP